MSRSLPLLLCLTLASASSLAQSNGLQAQKQNSPSVPTLHARTQLVIVDVVVTDSHQNPIHNLKASDFTLLESNQSQQIKNFEEHTALSTAEANRLEPMPKMPPGIFTNYSPAPINGSVNILLIDALNTPMKDQPYIRDQLRQYLKSANPGTRIAIFGLTTRLTLLQGFTTDPELQKTAINLKNPKASPLLDEVVGGGGVSEALSDTLSESSFGNSPDMADLIANLQQFEAQQESFQLQLRAKYTRDAMNQLARYLTGIPGRKNLIWFSGSFPINILPDGDLQNPFAIVASSEDEFRETTSLLTRSQVAVYPIDARGLMTSPVFSAANSGSKYVRNPSAFGKDQSKFFLQTAQEHGTMQQMAEDTGGRAFYNTNGLSQAVTQAISAGSNYYTLAYSPADAKWNGAYRKIQLKLQQPGLILTYRRGYYADDPDAPARHGTATAAATPIAPLDPMRTAMMRGAPDPTQVLFKVAVTPAGDPTEDKLAAGNSADPKIKGPYRRYSVSYAASPRDISFNTQPNGTYQAHLQFLVFVYDQDGGLLNSVGNTVKANLGPEAYNTTLRTGVHFQQQISVPVKGKYFLRIGIQDLSGGRVGALEVPVAAVKNLAPPPAPAANSPAVAPK